MSASHDESTGRMNDWPEKVVDIVFWCLDGRALVVSTFYWIGCLMFGVVSWKIAVVFLMTYVAQVLPLGRRNIERFALLFMGVATTYWIEVMPIHEWAVAAKGWVTSTLQSR